MKFSFKQRHIHYYEYNTHEYIDHSRNIFGWVLPSVGDVIQPYLKDQWLVKDVQVHTGLIHIYVVQYWGSDG